VLIGSSLFQFQLLFNSKVLRKRAELAPLWFLLVLGTVLSRPGECRAQELNQIRWGVTSSPAGLPIWIAKDSHIFKKYGLSGEIILTGRGIINTMSVMSGQMDFGADGPESVIGARLEGGDVLLLACPSDGAPIYLIARPEIRNIADLKGKRAGVTSFGSTTHLQLRTALRYGGLDPEKDMTILQLGTEVASALEAGTISASAMSFGAAIQFLERGWPVLVDLSKTDFVYPASCVISSRSFLNKKREVVERMMRAYTEAIQLIKVRPLYAAQVYAKTFRFDLEKSKRLVNVYAPLFKSIPYVPDKGLESALKEVAMKRSVPKRFIDAPESFRDHTILDKLVTQGWFENLKKLR
jgi:ABC-type nitrate/sulfonate/bicarbonate transport system substrate-binding protein